MHRAQGQDTGLVVDLDRGRRGALVPVGRGDPLAGVHVQAAFVGDAAVPVVAAAVLEVLDGRLQGAAHHVGRPAGGGAGVVRHPVGVGWRDLDLVGVDTEQVRGQLRDRLGRALSHLGGAAEHLEAAVVERGGGRPRPCWASASP